jgi:hypothetical protein
LVFHLNREDSKKFILDHSAAGHLDSAMDKEELRATLSIQRWQSIQRMI